MNVRVEVLELFTKLPPDTVLESLEFGERDHPKVHWFSFFGDEEPILKLIFVS